MLIRDDKSYLTMDVEAIRLIAVSSTGEIYNTLTNAAGDLINNDQLQLQFEIRQKKRQLNLHKTN